MTGSLSTKILYILVFITIVLLPSCSVTLPDTLSTTMTDTPEGDRCVEQQNKRLRKAQRRATAGDLLAILGGGLSLAGGATATYFEATQEADSKDAIITASLIAAAAGFMTLVGNYVGNPTDYIAEWHKNARHLQSGLEATDANQAKMFFTRCTLGSPLLPNQTLKK